MAWRGERLLQEKPANGHERGIHLIGRALVIGNSRACCRIEIAQHVIEGGESANSVPVMYRENPIIEFGGTSSRDGRH